MQFLVYKNTNDTSTRWLASCFYLSIVGKKSFKEEEEERLLCFDSIEFRLATWLCDYATIRLKLMKSRLKSVLVLLMVSCVAKESNDDVAQEPTMNTNNKQRTSWRYFSWARLCLHFRLRLRLRRPCFRRLARLSLLSLLVLSHIVSYRLFSNSTCLSNTRLKA